MTPAAGEPHQEKEPEQRKEETPREKKNQNEDERKQQDPVISIRIVHIDHYTHNLHLYSSSLPFQAAQLTSTASTKTANSTSSSSSNQSRLPVIRIFGTTPAGQKCCLHLHALRPYLHVPVPLNILSPHSEPSEIYSFSQSFRKVVESCLHMTFNPNNPNDNNHNDSAQDFTYIANIQPVLSTSVYGYQKNPTLFLKISSYAPSTITRVAMLLNNNALPSPFNELNRPHDAHIPFTLQFLTDYSLAGMDYIHLSSCKFRLPLPPNVHKHKHRNSMSAPMPKRFFTHELEKERPDLFWPFTVSKRSTSQLELDAFGNDILNPRMSSQSHRHNYGFVNRTLQVLWEEERLRTGVQPVRTVHKPRKVLPGAHLSCPDMVERLEEILRPEVEEDIEGQNEIIEDSEVEQEDDGANLSQLSDVLGYLDSSVPRDDYDDPLDHIDDDDDDEEADLQSSIEQEWKDIADCTQQVTKLKSSKRNKEENRKDSRLESPLPSSSRIYVIPSPPPETPRTPYQPRELTQTPPTIRHTHTRTPTNSQSQQPIVSHANSVIFRRKTRPPLLSSLLKEGDSQKLEQSYHIEWGTPYYSSISDYQSSVSTKSIRKPDAEGFPLFPLPFSSSTSPSNNLIRLSRIVSPAYKPPTMSRLFNLAKIRQADNHSVENEAEKAAIDSAGRFVDAKQHFDAHADIKRALNLHSVFVNGESFHDIVMNVKDADNLVIQIKKDSQRRQTATSTDAGEGDSGEEKAKDEEGSFSIKRVSTNNLSQDNEAVLPNQILSPKYDEAFQITVNPSTSRSLILSSSATSSQNETPRRTKTARSSASTGTTPLKTPTATPTLSESPHKHQNLTYMSIEILAESHTDKLPDPSQNEILAICTIMKTDSEKQLQPKITIFAKTPETYLKSLYPKLLSFSSEYELLNGLASHIQLEDVDVLIGFEIQNSSIGYIIERSQNLSHPFTSIASRWLIKNQHFNQQNIKDNNASNPAAVYYNRKGADVHITGRHLISLWRIIRTEVKLPSYSKEDIAYSLFSSLTFPRYSNDILQSWYKDEKKREKQQHRSIEYLKSCNLLNVAIADKLNVLSRTGELARVYGIDFMSALTRGSQYRVESMLRRVSNARNYKLLSANRNDVFKQPAVEALPLVMEPKSGMYTDPVIVLDFQSLYPSIIIAHNLCFSTMLGNINRVQTLQDLQHVGVLSNYQIPNYILNDMERFKNHIFISSNGEMFLDHHIHKGILPQMLSEILETRIMVKSSMKRSVGLNDDNNLYNLLNARQFALKMIANVTYGYTSASFSGRMPCSGLADAIVQCGRDALEKICDYVDEQFDGKAEVVYGDTDSLFVRVKGGNRNDAFKLGEQIVNHAFEIFPHPMQLKLEKVYQPCILQTKKRYVGYCYEHKNQSIPTFDAKGIETVRRDSCTLVQKSLERMIRLLFETKNLSVVKSDLKHLVLNLQQLHKIPLTDFVFRKEVRLGSYKQGHLPPAAIVATKAIEKDQRAAPRHGERVPFVVVYDQPGAKLKQCVMSPQEYVKQNEQAGLRLNITYYITKQILPAFDRILSLVGVKVSEWYVDFPKLQIVKPWNGGSNRDNHANGFKGKGKKVVGKNTKLLNPGQQVQHQSVLPMFYAVAVCIVCRQKCRTHDDGSDLAICGSCMKDERSRQSSRWVIEGRRRGMELNIANLRRSCRECMKEINSGTIMECCNLTCLVHEKLRVQSRLLQSLWQFLQDNDGNDDDDSKGNFKHNVEI